MTIMIGDMRAASRTGQVRVSVRVKVKVNVEVRISVRVNFSEGCG